MPASALTWAMPAPIMPAPSTPILRQTCVGTAFGRDASLLASPIEKKRLRIMLRASGESAQLTK
jgi:hypothetical protein